MMKNIRSMTLGVLILIIAASAWTQQASKHVLSADEVKKATPTEYFYRGQKGPGTASERGWIPAGRWQNDAHIPGRRLRIFHRDPAEISGPADYGKQARNRRFNIGARPIWLRLHRRR